MIAKLNGRIDELKPTEVILDVNGVGYHLKIPFSTYEGILDQDEVSLHVYTYHKEDQLKLFGFLSEKEKSIFAILINISGVGPVMALSILSGININQLVDSVRRDDPSILIRIPGVGKNKAEKLIFELKRKMKRLEDFVIDTPQKSVSLYNDALEALISLGFDEKKSSQIIDSIINENTGISIEDIVKNALRRLSPQQ
jgi:Holliday junction DNA helicase RuvA